MENSVPGKTSSNKNEEYENLSEREKDYAAKCFGARGLVDVFQAILGVAELTRGKINKKERDSIISQVEIIKNILYTGETVLFSNEEKTYEMRCNTAILHVNRLIDLIHSYNMNKKTQEILDAYLMRIKKLLETGHEKIPKIS